ncbi:MAG: Rossmann-like domain-containing protein [Candidatus Asgardarchaeia archaeon]
MISKSVYPLIRNKFREIANEKHILDDVVVVKARILTPEEAIGKPKRKDFPLVKGEEKMIEAEFNGAFGQAFTDQPSNFEGPLSDVLNLSLSSNKERAIFIATLNAVLRHLNLINQTKHCKNQEPEICSKKLVDFLKENFNPLKVGIIGFQPAFVDHLRRYFKVRVSDLNIKNIGKKKYGILIENGNKITEEIIEWADIVLATGSCVVNGTIDDILTYSKKHDKEVIFYGVTIAGAAYLLNLNRWCSMAS